MPTPKAKAKAKLNAIPERLKHSAPKKNAPADRKLRPRDTLIPLKPAVAGAKNGGRKRLTAKERSLKSKLPTNGRMILAAERREKMLELRIAGVSERAIAREMGINPTSVASGLKVAVDQLKAHTLMLADDYRRLELERCDKLTLALFARRGDPRTADTLLRIMERRAKLLGLDSPTLVSTRNETVSTVKHNLDRLSDDDLAVLEATLLKLETPDGDVGG